jgi:hypothetical protein
LSRTETSVWNVVWFGAGIGDILSQDLSQPRPVRAPDAIAAARAASINRNVRIRHGGVPIAAWWADFAERMVNNRLKRLWQRFRHQSAVYHGNASGIGFGGKMGYHF